jgi:transcription antitermination factor NusG
MAEEPLATYTKQWFALLVKANWEKRVNQLLCWRGLDVFLPLYTKRSRWSDRITTVDLPLFPKYVFCKFNMHDRLLVLTTPGVLQIVSLGLRPTPVDERQLTMIRIAVNANADREPHPNLKNGQRVRIIRGPLEGVEGVLIESRSGWRILLAVDVLERSVSVAVLRSMVTAVEQPGARLRHLSVAV